MADNTPTQEAQVKEQVKGKTVFSLSAPTPMWCTWIFRAEFVLNKVVLYVLSSTTLITPEHIKEALVWIAAVDMITWGFGRFVGVQKQDFETDNNNNNQPS